MTREVIFAPEAVAEFEHERAWYADKHPSLGDRFTECIRVSVERIRAGPQHFPRVGLRARRALIEQFPFAIIFVDEPNRVHVLAVFNTARSPSVWLRRLDGVKP